MQKASNVLCYVGNSVCRVTFIVTKLLHNVDLVLGINWLSQWNLVIEWRKTKVGQRTMKEYLVTWRGYPLEDAQWILEANWRDPKMPKT